VASQQVLELAIRSRCSAYDCEFIALAQDLRVPFVTADRQVPHRVSVRRGVAD
jgi:predicted nucleic acid-binding protein